MIQDSINLHNKIDSMALAHSQRLVQIIQQSIATHGGKINFAEFMQQALYAPGLGYYSNGSQKFGAHGDFITAPELGTLFAKCLAAQLQQILALLESNVILEIGAGSGKLAGDVCRALAATGLQLDTYYILELSSELQQRQQQYLQNKFPEFYSKFIWVQTLPKSLDCVIVANEVIDAMPVRRFAWIENKLQEFFVTCQDKEFNLSLAHPTQELVLAFSQSNLIEQLDFSPQPYVSEINLWLWPWIKSLSTCVNRGAVLLFDYGFSRSEYYHPQRNTGTLMCHYQQHCHPDPFFYPGLQDITAHVDFTAVAEAASANDFDLAGFTNQASFLINCGLGNFASQQTSREVNTLSSPAEMGELFKAMLLTKNLDLMATGFSQFDKLHTL